MMQLKGGVPCPLRCCISLVVPLASRMLCRLGETAAVKLIVFT